jgi:hypothetical protein
MTHRKLWFPLAQFTAFIVFGSAFAAMFGVV